MEIFLVRHAIAVERSVHLPDEERPLSARGVKRFARAVRGMSELGIGFDHVWHSPWLRAVQTAAMLAPITHGSRDVTDLLADDPGPTLIGLAGRLARRQPDQRVAYVGHEPWMSELLALLLTGTTHCAENMPCKKGSVAWLRGQPG